MIDTEKLPPHQIPSMNIDLPFGNVGELLECRTQENPAKTALICPGITEDVFTFGQLRENYLAAADYLSKQDLSKGDRINIIFHNSPEFIFLYLGCLVSGLTIAPINPDISPDEMLYIISDSQAKIVFTGDDLRKKAEILSKSLPEDIRLVRIKHYSDYVSAGDAGAFVIPDVSLTDIAVIIYTSGTTGNPKGVVLSHLNLLADAKAISACFQFNQDTRALCILPMFHNNGQIATLLAPFYAGGSTVIIKGKASLMAFWGLAEKYGVTWTSMMASILSILLSLPAERKDQTMQGILCGGQVLTHSVQEAFEGRFKVTVFEGYGLTETTSFSCINDYPAERRKIGSIGKPLPVNDMTILDEEGRELPHAAEGEICIRGYNVAVEYLGLPEKNDLSFRAGWFHSGDYGYKDAEGYFYFLGRKDSLIIKGGENIYPAEIENVIFKHPAVEECAAIGIPDELLGENICVFVKCQGGSAVDEKELLSYCRDKIARYKRPKKILFIEETGAFNGIPKGPTKKVLYRVLKQYYLDKYVQ